MFQYHPERIIIDKAVAAEPLTEQICGRFPEVPTQVVEIVGYFGPPPVVGINFSDDRSSGLERLSPEIFRAQRVDFSTLRSEIEISSLMSTVFYLDEAEIGALKVARKLPGSGAEKHEAYATQWFSMAFVLAFIGLWNSFRKKDHDD